MEWPSLYELLSKDAFVCHDLVCVLFGDLTIPTLFIFNVFDFLYTGYCQLRCSNFTA